MKKTPSPLNYEFESVSNYRKGLDRQREKFKAAKMVGDYDIMADSLENIKSEIKNKSTKKGRKKQIVRIENILDWYRNKEKNYLRNTINGQQIVFPPDMPIRVNLNLTKCFELLITEMDNLDLL